MKCISCKKNEAIEAPALIFDGLCQECKNEWYSVQKTEVNENEKVTTWNDECPAHKTTLKAQYEFGNKMHPSMTVSVFQGCACACSHRENDTRYHTSYANAKGAAELQKAIDHS